MLCLLFKLLGLKSFLTTCDVEFVEREDSYIIILNIPLRRSCFRLLFLSFLKWVFLSAATLAFVSNFLHDLLLEYL